MLGFFLMPQCFFFKLSPLKIMTEPVDRLDHSVIFIRNSINHISSLGYSDNLKNDYFNRS